MIFVDTSGWYAAYVPSDLDYSQVKPLLDNATTRLVTTNYILAEFVTNIRGHSRWAPT